MSPYVRRHRAQTPYRNRNGYCRGASCAMQGTYVRRHREQFPYLNRDSDCQGAGLQKQVVRQPFSANVRTTPRLVAITELLAVDEGPVVVISDIVESMTYVDLEESFVGHGVRSIEEANAETSSESEAIVTEVSVQPVPSVDTAPDVLAYQNLSSSQPIPARLPTALDKESDILASSHQDANPPDSVVRINLYCDSTTVGEAVAIVGASSDLGEWDVSKALRLRTDAKCFPWWTNDVQWSALTADFKFIIIDKNGHAVWEMLPSNRCLLSEESVAVLEFCSVTFTGRKCIGDAWTACPGLDSCMGA